MSFCHGQDDFSVEVTIFGLSLHENRSEDWNEVNPGLGLNFIYNNDNNVDLILSIGQYEDSYYETAEYVLFGVRKLFGNREAFHFGISGHAGYFDGSGFDNGYGGMLMFRAGYDRVSLDIVGQPSMGGEREAAFVACMLSIRVFEF